MKEKLRRFLWGRYGGDSLGYALIIISLLMSLVSSLSGAYWSVFSTVLWIISYAILIFQIFRMFSRNIPARRRENEAFMKLWLPLRKWFKLQRNRIRDRKTHKYFSCPKCKNTLRVPKGHGDITVTCPVCKEKFDRRS